MENKYVQYHFRISFVELNRIRNTTNEKYSGVLANKQNVEIWNKGNIK